MVNKKEKIKKEIAIQKKIEGESDNLNILLSFLDIVKSGSQWDSFVNCKFYSYGKLSYEAHRFYYPSKELLKLFETKKKLLNKLMKIEKEKTTYVINVKGLTDLNDVDKNNLLEELFFIAGINEVTQVPPGAIINSVGDILIAVRTAYDNSETWTIIKNKIEQTILIKTKSKKNQNAKID